MTPALFVYETEKWQEGYTTVVGVDEAGRGPLAGPVVAAAAAPRNRDPVLDTAAWKLIRDSKTLSEKQRETAYAFVAEQFVVGVGIVSSETIDQVNILEATFLAMQEAVVSLQHQREYEHGMAAEKVLILVDGSMTIPHLLLDQEAIVDGDALVTSIAAASIIAKVTRDRMMGDYDLQYPLYGFAKHKGYGTAVHMAALRRYGPCPIHRMNFKPVRNATIEGINQQLRRKHG